MVKKVVISIVTILVLLGSGVVIFRDNLMSLVIEEKTRDMFVQEDLDDYDPGIALTDPFPPIKVVRDGEVFSDLLSFRGSRGLVVFFNRSVVW